MRDGDYRCRISNKGSCIMYTKQIIEIIMHNIYITNISDYLVIILVSNLQI